MARLTKKIEQLSGTSRLLITHTTPPICALLRNYEPLSPLETAAESSFPARHN